MVFRVPIKVRNVSSRKLKVEVVVVEEHEFTLPQREERTVIPEDYVIRTIEVVISDEVS